MHTDHVTKAEEYASQFPNVNVTLQNVASEFLNEHYKGAYPSGLVRTFPNGSTVTAFTLPF